MASEVGLVLRATAGFVRVGTGDGEIECRVRGRLKRGRASTDLAVIGDEVELERTGEGTGVVTGVRPRRTTFSRLHPAARGRELEDVLVANLDRLFVVFSASVPVLVPRLVDRFLVVGEHSGVPITLVATKVDEAAAEALGHFAGYAALGYELVQTSARSGEGLEALRGRLGGISAFVGPSGTGKSSLLNALCPGLGLRVGAVGQRAQTGRHTICLAELHPLPGGGYVADTPGIRELAGFRIPTRELARCFPDLAPHAERCAFSDCLHDREPGCGVREARLRGEIRADRHDSYLRQLHGEDLHA